MSRLTNIICVEEEPVVDLDEEKEPFGMRMAERQNRGSHEQDLTNVSDSDK